MSALPEMSETQVTIYVVKHSNAAACSHNQYLGFRDGAYFFPLKDSYTFLLYQVTVSFTPLKTILPLNLLRLVIRETKISGLFTYFT